MRRGLAVVAVVACGAALPASAGPTPVPCTEQTAKALVREFTTKISVGRADAAERLFAPEPRFYWYSANPPGARLRGAAYRRSTLLAYLRARGRHHERLRTVTIRSRHDPARGVVDFFGKLARSADDMRPRVIDFKGAADCDPRGSLLIVWSM